MPRQSHRLVGGRSKEVKSEKHRLIIEDLPDGSGIDLIAELNANKFDVLLVVASIFDDDTNIFAVLGAGASWRGIVSVETV